MVQVTTLAFHAPATLLTRHTMLRWLVLMLCWWSMMALETCQQQLHPRTRIPPGSFRPEQWCAISKVVFKADASR